MRILITTDLFTTDTNGVVTSVKNLCDELQKKGHDVRILTLSENRYSRKEGNVIYIRSMPIGVYPDIRMPTSYRHNLIKELVKWNPDVIHSQCEFFSFQFAKYISQRTGAPIVHTYHTMYEEYISYVIPFERLGKWLVRVLSQKRLKPVKTIIVPTHKVENTLRGYAIDKTICVIPSGVCLDQHKLRLTDDERIEKRRALGISDDYIILLNLGRLGTEKNLEELLRFYAKAVKENDKLSFLIVGDGPAKAELEELSVILGISDNVIFTGMVKPIEVQNYYQLGDVFVSASTSETQGLTYIEAAANGLPLLCRQDECLQDVILQGKNGYEYTTDSEFVSYLNAIAKDAEWRKYAGKRSEEISKKFDKQTFGNSVESVYYSVISTQKF